MLYSYALLTADQLRAVRQLETEMGRTIVAFQRQEIDIAELSTEELARIREEEEKLGLALVAVAL
jgi:hypothetical protein